MPRRPMTVTDSVDVSASPEAIWTQVADPANMPRWSPENTGAPDGAGRILATGDVFTGRNKRGPARWITRCTVTASEPGQVFSFDVQAIGVRAPWLRGKIANWTYTFEPVGSGTRVTETWTDHRSWWPDWFAAGFDKVATGSRFYKFQVGNIGRTLKNLKADFEA
ncbi:SRPBCC family protein [Nocardioides marmorisolisilvae]|uniref:SRPBCC family protein n=1 Tax=Nocardioides marmorisolisilvae TaxID=1542737 RepID=A0A3N0DU23_9ACTN|nr:SRPBCC family protein [Nocardioides marmorisolisilvae]RNL79129.1 SRPBCC family protein [Nocardioides marmorisolisilvae]